MAHKPQTAVGRQSSWLYSAEIGAFDSLRDFVVGVLERKWAVFSLGSSSKLRRLRFQADGILAISLDIACITPVTTASLYVSMCVLFKANPA